ncbi:D-alanyl-D-alanine carboxypeptidase [Lentilactobacillus otakiensis]|uniref:D-alanyl-D-alanine carboxypeptidase n=1 Tax=Lentilactobacillus otakiensis TaxID=481720 RepID=UPI003D16ED0A
MQKRFVKFLSLALLAMGIVMGTQQVTSHAWTSTNKYTWRSGKDQAAIYYTNTKKNAYIWNSHFSKKLHNLKNYQYTTWCVTRSFVRKNKVYYSISNLGGKVKGYVWHGYVTPAVVKDINRFNSDSDYLNYLNTDKSQKLSRALLKLIPNANISLDLSKQAAMNKITDYQDVINLGMVSGTVTEGMITTKTIVHDFLMAPNSSISGRATTVGKMLAAKGYTRDKLASLMSQGYQVGIYVNDGAANSVGKSGYPSTISFTTPIQNNMALVLAKAK